MDLKQSVIICTRNRPDDVVRCLNSLMLQSLIPQELIVVDSSDKPVKQNERFIDVFASQKFPRCSLKYIHTKPGLTFQRNKGIDSASGDIIYFFDDDVVLEKNYLEKMSQAFRVHPECAGGMGTVTNIIPLSWKYRLFRSLFLLQRTYSSGYFTWSGMPTHPYGTKYFKKVEVVGGCCMAFRKEALEKEKFDESFKGYSFMEDSDIARRVSFSQSLFFNPEAKLAHLESPIARDQRSESAQMFIKNYSYLFFKHFYSRNKLKLVAYWWSIFGLFLEALLLRDWPRWRGYMAGIKHFYGNKREK